MVIGGHTQNKTLAQMALTRGWGGLEMMAFEYASCFARRGYQSSLITLENSPLEKYAQDSEVPVLTLEQSRYVSPSLTFSLRKLIDDKQIQTIFVHHLRDLWLLRPALIGHPQVKVFGFAHMFLHDIKKTDFLHRWLYSRLEKLIALTQLQKRELLKCLPVRPEDVVVIPNGIDFHKFSPSRRDEEERQRLFQVSDNQVVIGVVGRLDPQKGQLEFLQSARLVKEALPNAVFALIGQPNRGETDYLRQLQSFIQSHGMQKDVRLIQHMNDVSRAMACLDIFVLPSYRETFGNVLVEAMASGVPVIATNAGGPSEIIRSGQTGILVTPRDKEEMAIAIIRLARDREYAAELAQNALKIGRAQFDLRGVLEKIEILMGSNGTQNSPNPQLQAVSPL